MEKELLEAILVQSSSIETLIKANAESSYIRLSAIALTSLVSTALGALLTYKVGNAIRKRSKVSESAKLLLDMLNEFECQCIEYWSAPYNQDNPEMSTIIEAKIRSNFQKIKTHFDHGHYGFSDKDMQAINQHISSLFDASTGGDFESKQRKASPKQIRKLTMIMSRLTPIVIKKSFGETA
jgi:hypothetical protein